MEASINPMDIPFNKAERVSNFKIWRTKSTITRVPTPEEREEIKKKSNGTRKAKSVSYPIECIHISNLLGSPVSSVYFLISSQSIYVSSLSFGSTIRHPQCGQ